MLKKIAGCVDSGFVSNVERVTRTGRTALFGTMRPTMTVIPVTAHNPKFNKLTYPLHDMPQIASKWFAVSGSEMRFVYREDDWNP